MVKNKLIQTICDKEMDRREFLKYSGIALLGVVGLKGLVALFMASEDRIASNPSVKESGRGFGSGKYGA